jgi:DNA-binding response OmpR family regulator
MIVEDDPGMHEIYKDIFSDKKDEYTIELLSDARVAYKRIRQSKFDMVILDIIMEPMDGNAFYALLRSKEAGPNITPVLVVSVVSPSDLDQMRKINNVDFLQKPITSEQLFAKIEAITGTLGG